MQEPPLGNTAVNVVPRTTLRSPLPCFTHLYSKGRRVFGSFKGFAALPSEGACLILLLLLRFPTNLHRNRLSAVDLREEQRVHGVLHTDVVGAERLTRGGREEGVSRGASELSGPTTLRTSVERACAAMWKLPGTYLESYL